MKEFVPVLWPAPAKLNLFLHITGRRMDGYHELQTLFQFIDFGDELRFRVDGSGVVRRREALAGVAEEVDLTVRAARLLQAETGCAQGVEIHIDKHLPMGGGLGGGSSDAATTLVALNRLWGLGLSEDRLAALGLQLGADVPVFVHGRAAWAEGVGERLQSVDLPEPWFVILQPDAHVVTAELFANPQLTRDLQPIKMRDYLAGDGRNVFEPLVRAVYPDVDAALVWLNARAAGRMTGTGACVFAAFEREAQARDVAAQAAGRWRAIVARGCNRSPLLTVCGG
ncbi:4-diphosphocytidyl-2-C-methyl-D-erythritol kinase [hydrothermal vent metagenome]|uniref:4-(cytidine 5'-diphospho)-2-C-methyl-D-erythritol kinase n=1 Tax=hydrothermal vent metagenome TaxID=652676 RepID=A0A3B1A627_9ZZZZ